MPGHEISSQLPAWFHTQYRYEEHTGDDKAAAEHTGHEFDPSKLAVSLLCQVCLPAVSDPILYCNAGYSATMFAPAVFILYPLQ